MTLEFMIYVSIFILCLLGVGFMTIQSHRSKGLRTIAEIGNKTVGMGFQDIDRDVKQQANEKYTDGDLQEFRHAVQTLVETGKYKTECPEPVMQYLLPLVTNLYDRGYISDVEKEMGGGFVSIKVTWKVKAKH